MEVVHAYKIYRPDADGGIPQVISCLCSTKNPDVRARIVVSRARGPSRSMVFDGIQVDAVGSLGTAFSMPLSPKFPIALHRAAKHADVVVHHAPFPLTDIAALSLNPRTALVIYWHAEVVGRGLLLAAAAPFMRAALSRADRIVVSDQSILNASTLLRPYQSKCAVIPYGLDVRYWQLAEQDAVARLRQIFPRLVLSAGRLGPYKGFDVLVSALPSIDCQLAIIGDGPLDGELRAQARRLQVDDRVHFLGRIEADMVRQYVHAARVFVLASVSPAEAFGLVQVEAMAAGCPVVNTSLNTAVPNVARHGHEGTTVEPGNPAALAAAVNELLADPKLARAYGESGQIRASSEFDQDVYRSRIENVLAEAIAHRRQSEN